MIILKPAWFLFVLWIATVNSRPQTKDHGSWSDQPRCGYASCPKTKANMLNVHLVPHTHDDVGWLKTVDQYYYGSKTLIQKAGVQYILDSVVEQLLKDPQKKFIYVESAFFFKWWKEQTPELQQSVKNLVNEGRLEFIGGAWSMNDEATTHYQSIIDQFAWGLRLLNDTFGECGRPRIGWQIDPFGHSREMASMFAQMGFDGLFFGRLDYQDKSQRLSTKTAEMIWRASANLGESSNLFTGALFNQYQPPPGFCFDILCADEPIIDGKHSPENNVDRRVGDFFDFINKQRRHYRTNNIILTMGGDFTYQDANVYYKNLDKLIRYGNAKQENGSDINLFYSTPSCYLKSLHDAGITWPTKDDDFFPYASDPHAYWTGYFTSRPTIKRYERVGNHFLQVCKQLTALAPKTERQFSPHLTFMRETMGIMQHHDAVTGTEKQKVAYDYAKRLSVAVRACSSNTRAVLNSLVTGEENEDLPNHDVKPEYKFEFKTCTLLNISLCDISETNEKFVLTLYNPLAHATYQNVRVPIQRLQSNYEVMDYRNVAVESQIVPIHESIKDLPFRGVRASHELVFLATDLPPMGYKSYYISRTSSFRQSPQPEVKLVKRRSLETIGNDKIKVTFDSNGFMASVDSNGISTLLNQEFLYYEGATGNNKEFQNRSSGAYIFRPNKGDADVLTSRIDLKIFRGSVVQEAHQKINDWISQVIRVYSNSNHVEFEWLVGPIPVKDQVGKEVITRYTSNIRSNGIFYTDSNGREMLKRKRNHRDTWKVNLQENVAGNYYPITTKIALQDEETRMAILIDRAQGGSSLSDGSLELMLHRRLLHDDAFGVEEPLNETAYGFGLVARGRHHLVVGPSKMDTSPTTQAQERILQLENTLPAWPFFSTASKYSYDNWSSQFNNIYSFLTVSLPNNIHLLTYEPWKEDQILVRFEHIFEGKEDPVYSKMVKVYVKYIFGHLNLVDMRETSLDGNQWLGDYNRLEFVPDPEGTVYSRKNKANPFVENAQKPMLRTVLNKEQIQEEDYTIAENEDPKLKELKKLPSVAVSKILDIRDINQQDDEDKYILEIEPMQIRTVILFLKKHI